MAASQVQLVRDWFVVRREGSVGLIRATDGAALDVTESVTSGDSPDVPAAVRLLAEFDPLAEDFVRAATDGAGVTDRPALLRGTGWSRLFVELTDRCNERCVHCYASSAPELTTTLDWPTLARVIEDGARLGFRSIQLTGGDPLLSPYCADAVRKAREHGIPEIEIATNGLALVGSLWEVLRDLRVSLAFSLYSHDAETHDALTATPGSHARTARAIQRATSAGLLVRGSIVLCGPNDAHESATRALLLSLGVTAPNVNCDVSRSVGRGVQIRTSGVAATQARGAEGLGHRPADRTFGGTIAVGADGDVRVCVFSRHRSLGNVRETPLAAIVERPGELRWPGDGPALRAAMLRAGARLTCSECQIRDVLLGSTDGP